MPKTAVPVSTTIEADPKTVYAILADYQQTHPQILPAKYFRGLQVERGGRGAGTVFTVKIRVWGVTRTMQMEVSEPEPGRVMVETDLKSRVATRFTVEPLDSGRRSQVTISTEWESRGIAALIERLLAAPVLGRMFRDELENLKRSAEDALRN